MNKNKIKATVSLLNKAILLANDRNLIAHNPLHLAFQDAPGGFDFKLKIVSLRDGEVEMDIEEARDLAQKIKAVSSNLYETFKELRFEEIKGVKRFRRDLKK